MSFKPYSEEGTVNIDGQTYACMFHRMRPNSWLVTCTYQGRSLSAPGPTKAAAEQALIYKADY